MPLEAQVDAIVGTVLEGRFQIEKLLGEGGMGRVYVAEELRLRRRCAVKVLLPELTQDKGCVERFLREAQAIAQIHHENVVDIYHLGEDLASGVVFFAMELLAGEDLESRLLDRARRPLTWQQACVWMAQVAGAVGAVHGAGMIHRDLKPSNIFIARRRDGRDQIKLLDFGIAKVANHAALTNTGAAIGTPFYMSPEQILAQALDTRTDIYSYGVLFFETLAGRMPFVGEPIQVAMQHCNVPPPRISAINPDADVPRELEDLVLSMLAKDRDARPQTMEEIEQYLLEFLPQAAVHTSGLHSSGASRPVTAQLSRTIEAAPPTPPGGLPLSTPSHALPAVKPAATRTSLDTPRPPATTVEIHLDADGPRADTPAPRKLTPVLIGVGVLGLAVAAFAFFSSGEDPVPPPRPEPLVIAPAKPGPPDPQPTTPSQPDPPASDTAADPVPPTSPPDPPPTKTDDPKVRKTGDTRPEPRPPDPQRQLQKAATACRKQHKATKGPKITVDYAIGSDGAVTRAVPSVQDALGKCLADAVKRTKFPPQLKLGLKIDL